MLVAVLLASNAPAHDLWRTDAKVLSCAPKVLRAGGTLSIALGPGHGSEMAIHRHSDNVYFFIVVRQPPVDMVSLMSPEEFAKARRTSLSAASTGYAWVHGLGQEPIFTTSGRYSVKTSETLESERGGYRCTFEFRK
jgi:hypothetical protein